MDSLKKEIDVQDRVLDVRCKKALDKREREEFEIALQHKSKLHLNIGS